MVQCHKIERGTTSGVDVTRETRFAVKQINDFVLVDHMLEPIRALLIKALR